MEDDPPAWILLERFERTRAWRRIHDEFAFAPSADPTVVPFTFRMPVDAYDISGSGLRERDEELIGVVRSIFAEAVGDDDYLLVLDWQHDGYRYDPRVPESVPADGDHDDGRFYPPEFFPHGEYYFFVACDLSWGYLLHPWREMAWVYGEPLRTIFRNHSQRLGFAAVSW